MCAFLLLFLWLIAAKKSNERRDPPFFLARQKPPFHGHVFVGCIARVIWLYLHIFAFYYADRQKALEGRAGEMGEGVREEASARHSVALPVSLAPLEEPTASVSFFGIDSPSAFFIRESYLHRKKKVLK